MPKPLYHTTREQASQASQSEDDWSKQILAQLPANLQEQARNLKAFERSRKISSASDLLRGLLAYVYTAHSFQHLSMWSVLLGVADVSANDWRKRLQKASAWLDWHIPRGAGNGLSHFDLARTSRSEPDFVD